jgi:hypothetical protein
VEERDQTQDTEREVAQDEEVEGHAVRDADDVEGHSFVEGQIEDQSAQDA